MHGLHHRAPKMELATQKSMQSGLVQHPYNRLVMAQRPDNLLRNVQSTYPH